jgi:hypothetical protein
VRSAGPIPRCSGSEDVRGELSAAEEPLSEENERVLLRQGRERKDRKRREHEREKFGYYTFEDVRRLVLCSLFFCSFVLLFFVFCSLFSPSPFPLSHFLDIQFSQPFSHGRLRFRLRIRSTFSRCNSPRCFLIPADFRAVAELTID